MTRLAGVELYFVLPICHCCTLCPLRCYVFLLFMQARRRAFIHGRGQTLEALPRSDQTRLIMNLRSGRKKRDMGTARHRLSEPSSRSWSPRLPPSVPFANPPSPWHNTPLPSLGRSSAPSVLAPAHYGHEHYAHGRASRAPRSTSRRRDGRRSEWRRRAW